MCPIPCKHWNRSNTAIFLSTRLPFFTLFFVCFMLCRYIASKYNMHISRSCKQVKLYYGDMLKCWFSWLKQDCMVRSVIIVKLLHFLVCFGQVYCYSASWVTFAWSFKSLNKKEHSLVSVSISMAVKRNHLCWTKKVIMFFHFLLLFFCW